MASCSVSVANSAETTVDERAEASISSSGSIVSCITPMRNGLGTPRFLSAPADDERHLAWVNEITEAMRRGALRRRVYVRARPDVTAEAAGGDSAVW